MLRFLLISLCVSGFLIPFRAAALDPGDVVAICGDSITEQQLYSVYVADYLLMCQPVQNARAVQLGWSGERADGFMQRVEGTVLPFSPTVATLCFGMNDGGYKCFTDTTANEYRAGLEEAVRRLKQAGVRVVIGSPGCVDTATFVKPNEANAIEYNQTLAALRDVAAAVAQEQAVDFADLYTPMHDAMKNAKAAYGDQYSIAGDDGIHPRSNGHLVMAYAFLKAMKVDGNIGVFTVNLRTLSASGSAGHQILSFDGRILSVESTRYPFCFLPDLAKPEDDHSPDSMRGILPFVPFNADLNRMTLIVEDAASPIRITWGNQQKTFSADQMHAGINLAAEFLDNPFIEPFQRVHALVREQQGFETPLMKGLLYGRLRYPNLPGKAESELNALVAEGLARHASLADAAGASVTPVRHSIVIEPANP